MILRAIALILSSAVPCMAEDFRMGLPVDCTIGKTCFIEDYVDQDPTQGRQRDFACGINARDGHKGTDIALLSFDIIKSGVDVLSVAPGTVLRTRDGMPDDRLMRGVTPDTACGNAALIDHGNGWQVLYCHMKKGSLTVLSGDTVQRGDPLGLVGLSGQTNHPHAHITVYHDGALVDPFQPSAQDQCGTGGETLWLDPPAYTATGIITAGFSDHVPSMAERRAGKARIDTSTANQPLVAWAHLGYAEHGDVLTFTAHGPEGTIFHNTSVLKSPQVSLLRAFGKKAPPDGWPKGEYLGEALLTRAGQVIAHRFAHVTIR